MEELEIEQLREYRKRIKYWRFSIAFFVVGGLALIAMDFYLQIALLRGALQGPISIILMAPMFYFGFRMAYFPCPRCAKSFCTKRYVFTKPASPECLHCGLSIALLPEVKVNKPQSHTEEWLK